MSAGAQSSALGTRRRRARSRLLWQGVAAGVAVALALAALFGAVFAGSPSRIPAGVSIAGVSVGGMTAAEAQRLLEGRAKALEDVPVVFFSGQRRWRITPHRLGVEADWGSAVDAALHQGDGLGPFRGLQRVRVRVFGTDIAPPAKVYEPALDYQLDQLSKELDQPVREAAIVLRARKPLVVPGHMGRVLDREVAAVTIVGALASLSRAPTSLPVKVEQPKVSAEDLSTARDQTRQALSAPIRLELGKTWWRLRPAKIAPLLALPRDGATELAIGGPGAEQWFQRFARTIGKPPADARFVQTGDGAIVIVPDRKGVQIDVDATRRAILAAVVAPAGRRVGSVVVSTKSPAFTTEKARSYGITRTLASYSTFYSGTADRINNLQLAVKLIDGTLVAPGGTFSLNQEVGPRTLERGFRVAPVIIGGEYEEDVGGGVSQVATTVFNAAWEAGVKVLERNPHSLYISRYPTGRDATVNYPDLDLKFLNDTGKWIVVLGGIGRDGISITLAGSPTGRRVVSVPGPLETTGEPPIERISDPTLFVGTKVVEESGSAPSTVLVKRTVYENDGSVLYDESWRTNYRGEKRVIRVGTKKKEEPKPPTTSTPTTTTPTTTTPTTPAPPPPKAPKP
ncbi:MAG TPA: VanW family protein [Gaiellaceae bacterium]|nr:VanW family protein [Gaiellaceae bacterium]